MDEENEVIDQFNETDSDIKYYSMQSILFASFLGGPMSAGILMRKNFLNQHKEKESILALIIGFLSMIFVISLTFFIPENILNKIPSIVFSFLYAGIAYLIAKKYFEKILEQHKSASKPFYSNWRVAGISIICVLFLFSGIYGVSQLINYNFDTEKYDKGIAEFTENETKALELFSLLEENDMLKIDHFITETGIPLWEENIEILKKLNKIEGLTEEFLKQNEMLLTYCELRIKSYLLIQKAVIESTDKYDSEIESIHTQINILLE